MVLRLDPHLPVVWRSPDSLQFGVSRPVVVMTGVTTATERMLAALATGVTYSGLEMIGVAAGATSAEVAALVTAVTPALRIAVPSPARRILVVGSGPTGERIVQVLASLGIDVWIAADATAAEAQHCEFAVAIGQFVLDPALHGLWLRRDIPHLGIVLGDTGVSIGPVVDPGRTACLYCLQFHATEADAAWPAIASQLWGRHSPADTELIATEVAGLTVRMVVAWLAGVSPEPLEARLDAASGRVTTAHYAPHPRCGCLQFGLANAVLGTTAATAPAPQETGSATAAQGVPAPMSPPGPRRG